MYLELHRTVFNLYLEQATWPIRQTQETDIWLSMAYMHATWTPLSCCKTTIVYRKYTWHFDIQCQNLEDQFQVLFATNATQQERTKNEKKYIANTNQHGVDKFRLTILHFWYTNISSWCSSSSRHFYIDKVRVFSVCANSRIRVSTLWGIVYKTW